MQQLARENGVTTIFYETLISPAVARSIAGDLGLKTDVLDPIEGITEQSKGRDYLAVMRSNLTALGGRERMPMTQRSASQPADLAAETVLDVNDLSVQLGGLPVLRGITLSVTAGEAVALLGGNGSGKSTLVRTLVGLNPPHRGSVQLFGRPLAQFRQWSRVGYVPQRSTTGMRGAKVREVVASGRLSHRRPFLPPRAEDRRAVSEALQAVGLAERAGDDLAVLSGGQQQRVLIARALAGRPDLLILDEPNAGVDLAHQEVLAGLLGNLIEAGTAVLVVLHEVGALGRLIDRAIVLSEGRVVHDGTLEDLGPAQPRPGHEHAHPDHGAGWLDGAGMR